MEQIINYLHNPVVVVTLYAGYNLLVDTMPEPKADGGNGYLWLYKILHAIAMNIKTARGLKMMVPQQSDAPATGAPKSSAPDKFGKFKE